MAYETMDTVIYVTCEVFGNTIFVKICYNNSRHNSLDRIYRIYDKHLFNPPHKQMQHKVNL